MFRKIPKNAQLTYMYLPNKDTKQKGCESKKKNQEIAITLKQFTLNINILLTQERLHQNRGKP